MKKCNLCGAIVLDRYIILFKRKSDNTRTAVCDVCSLTLLLDNDWEKIIK